MPFTARLLQLVAESVIENHQDNFMIWEGQPLGKASTRKRVQSGWEVNAINQAELMTWAPLFHELELLSERLEDEASRDLLARLVAYRLMGCQAIKLPMNTTDYLALEKSLESLGKPIDLKVNLNVGGGDKGGYSLREFDLTTKGFDLRVLAEAEGVATEYCLQQYRCPELGVVPRPGDVVIDCGAFLGETALHFGHDVGARGSVFAFEFEPANVRIFSEALARNPTIAQRIELVPHPLWSESGIKMDFVSNGPGSRLKSIAGENEGVVTVSTKSIDDLVSERALDRVDFIKMDIEGAELLALQGARNTIRRFRPKLAICLYHKPSHFVEIPSLIHELVPEYRFRIGHYSLNQWETVLYAAT